MKTFQTTAAQGEVAIDRIASLPNGAKKVEPVNGLYILGHSETGHHHVMEAGDGVDVYEAIEGGMKCLYAVLANPGSTLDHLRDFDKHEQIRYDTGIFRHGNLVERDPYEGTIRRQAD